MEINLFVDLHAKLCFVEAGKYDQMAYTNTIGLAAPPSRGLRRIEPGGQGNYIYSDDPYYKDLIQQALNATTMEEA